MEKHAGDEEHFHFPPEKEKKHNIGEQAGFEGILLTVYI